MNPEHAEDLHAELGYRTTGQREIRQREWFSLRGEASEPIPTPREFAKVVNRLRAKKWAKENPERRKEIARRYYQKPDKKARQLELAAKRYKARQRTEARVFTCRECSAEFCKAPWTKGPLPNFCRDACYQVNRYHRLRPGARRNKPSSRIYTRKPAT